MDTRKGHTTEVWAQLLLSESDRSRIQDFLVSAVGVKPSRVVRNMHLTVYYARRPIPGVVSTVEPAGVLVPAQETRFMVMAPGGENPRPELEPGKRKVGIRIRRGTSAFALILGFRARLLEFETKAVLGKRPPSTQRRNAFGARYFQPHMALLRAGSGIDGDLTKIGKAFREVLGTLTFDTFVIDVVTRRSDSSS